MQLDVLLALVDAYSAHIGIALLLLMFVGFVLERFPATVVAVLGVCAFLVLGLLDSRSFLQSFANSAPVTIGAMFVLSAALARTGVLELAANWIVARAKKHPIRATAELVLAVFPAAAFMNNTPVVAIMIPIVISLSVAIGISSQKLLIPLSYLAMLSGTLTLVGTSTNLLVDGIAQESGLEPFGIFESTPVGLIVAIVGTIALIFLSRYLLPGGKTDPYHSAADELFLSEVRIPRESRLIGKRISEASELRRVQVIGLNKGGKRVEMPDRPLTAGDRLIVKVKLGGLMTLRDASGIEVGGSAMGKVEQNYPTVVEATISPSHPSIGRKIREIPFLNSNPVRLLGINRHGHLPGPSLMDAQIRAADTVLVTGSPEALLALQDNPNLIGVERTEGQAFRPGKAPIAIGALAGAVILSALGIVPILISSLIAVGIVLATRCIDGDEAWASLDGNVLMLVYAMLAVGAGLESAGSVTLIVGAIAPMLQTLSPLALLFAIYLCSSALTEAISNNAVAVIMTPIVIALGADLGVDPRPLVIAVMFAASASFATPISYQTNTMVYAAGNYRFADFLRIGLPMNVVVGLTTCFSLAVLY